jgi:hypothetical protein
MRTIKILWCAIALATTAGCYSGCATHNTILIDSQRDMVLILKPVKTDGAVWRHGHWEEAGTVTLPPGWVAGPERAAPKP